MDTFDERFRYLSLHGQVGDATFGFDRWINQQFYTSREWKQIRHHVIARDLACDLGIEGYEIFHKIIIHHMNPMQVNDIAQGDSSILDPEFLISVTHKTHNAIHYGDDSILKRISAKGRAPGDTKLW